MLRTANEPGRGAAVTNGRGTVHPIDDGWVLLPHGMPNLAVHLPATELITMLDSLQERL